MTYCGPDLFLGGQEKSGRHQPPARSTCATRAARSARRRGRSVVALRPLGVLPIDAVQQHGQFGGAHADAGLAFDRRRETEDAGLQPLEARITLSSYSGRYRNIPSLHLAGWGSGRSFMLSGGAAFWDDEIGMTRPNPRLLYPGQSLEPTDFILVGPDD